MPTKNRKTDPHFLAAYERGMLRSAFVSLFWAVISERKKTPGGFTFQSLAETIGSTKHEVSRWFNGDPNWTINTIAKLAHGLGLEIQIHARERATGRVFTSSGPVAPAATQIIADPLKPLTETVRSPQSVTVRSNNPDMRVELAA